MSAFRPDSELPPDELNVCHVPSADIPAQRYPSDKQIIAAFLALPREAVTMEGAATRTVSVAAAAGLPAAFAL